MSCTVHSACTNWVREVCMKLGFTKRVGGTLRCCRHGRFDVATTSFAVDSPFSGEADSTSTPLPPARVLPGRLLSTDPSAAVAISDAAGCGTAATGRAGNGCLSLVAGEVEESPKISFSRIPPWFPAWLCFFSVRVENASGAIRSAKVVFGYTNCKQITSS